MDKALNSYQYGHWREGRLISSVPVQKSSSDTVLALIITIILCILVVFVILARVHLSTKITDTGYKITALTKEKLRLLEERDRLNAEIAYLKSAQNLKKMLNNTQFVEPSINKIIRVTE